ncbi:hypothetical protein DM002_24620, partial [Salmonella enterica subsp. enterica serovar Agona]|nr:hypothetical protein [Salmonella enterica subsp. enterica serovar Agona]
MNTLDKKVITVFEKIAGRKIANGIMILLGISMILVSTAVLLILCSAGVIIVMRQPSGYGFVLFAVMILICSILSRFMLSGSLNQLREY